MTNREYLNTLSDEKLASFLSGSTQICNEMKDYCDEMRDDYKTCCKECTLRWLKMEHIQTMTKEERLRKKLRNKFIKERNKEYKDYYSNCLFEAIKAKIKCGKRVQIIYIPSWKNEVFCPHFMWHDLATDTIKDFHAEYGYIEKWYNFFLFKGHIRCRPYSVYERWLKTNKWH